MTKIFDIITRVKKSIFKSKDAPTSNDIPEHQETFLRRAYEWLAATGIVLSSILGIYSVIIVVGFILFSIGRLFDKLLFPAMGKIAAFCMAVVVGFYSNICQPYLSSGIVVYEIDCDGKTGDVLGKQEFISNFEGQFVVVRHEDGTGYKLDNCLVMDKKNWTCSHSSETFSAKNGKIVSIDTQGHRNTYYMPAYRYIFSNGNLCANQQKPPLKKSGFNPVRHQAEEFFLQGKDTLKSGKINESIQLFHEAIKTDATFGGPHRNLGIAFAKLGDAEAAIKHYRIYLNLSPDAYDAQQVKAIIKAYEENKRP